MSGNKNSGRLRSSKDALLISKLDNVINSEDAILKLKQFIEDGNFKALQLYLAYRFGSPKRQIEIEAQNPEQPLFDLIPKIVFTHRKPEDEE